MSSKNVIESNTDKILNSDIYDLTSFVDEIKKRNKQTRTEDRENKTGISKGNQM